MGLIKVGNSVIKTDAFSNKYETVTTASTSVFNTNFDISSATVVVYVDGVRQQASAYSVSGARQITLSEAVVAGTAVAISAMDTSPVQNLAAKANLDSPTFTGNVGIGTTNPSNYGKLAIAGSIANAASALGTADAATFAIVNNASSALNEKASLSFWSNNTSKAAIAGFYENYNGVGDTGTGLIFGTQYNTAGGVVERMRINSSGNVGIGTASPSYKLDIQGSSGVGMQIYETSTGKNNRLIITQQGDISTYNSTFTTGSGLHVWQIGNSDKMRLNNNGNLGIGTSDPTSKLMVSGSSDPNALCTISVGSGLSTDKIFRVLRDTSPIDESFVIYRDSRVIVKYLAGTGNRAVYSDASGTLTNSSSDFTLKTNIESINYGLAEVLEMNPIMFQWKDTEKMGAQKEIGFIAQEMEKIIPEVIGINSNGLKSLDYPKLVAVLCKAVQELSTKNDALEARLLAAGL